jgi:hypothetical protein
MLTLVPDFEACEYITLLTRQGRIKRVEAQRLCQRPLERVDRHERWTKAIRWTGRG